MIISRDKSIFAMSKDNEPVARIKSGDKVTFETMDCFSCALKSEADRLSGIDFNRVNPATGPVYVEGAEVGDTLKVTIEEIQVEDQAVTVAEPGFGRLGKDFDSAETAVIKINGDRAEFRGLDLPLNKMVGVIGTAPAGPDMNTGTPGDHGGNLDCTQVKEGSSIYLPVNVEGGLLAMGDLHALMGDGEISGAGGEVSGSVRVLVEVIENFEYELPLIETDDKWICLASRETMDEATDKCLSNMKDLIMKKTNLTSNEAIMLMSLKANLIPCQVVNPNKTMRVEIDKSIIE